MQDGKHINKDVKMYKKQNVYEAALERIRFVFDEFPNVAVNVSGGKDSTVIFHLALQVAQEKGRLPLKTIFVDQEAEWAATIDIIREIMYHPDVDPMWYQVPIKLLNTTSAQDQWLHCWEPGKEADWIHPQDPISIKENTYGADRFTALFDAILKKDWAGKKAAFLTGVRGEESPRRQLGLTHYATYKYITWGRKVDKKTHQYHLHPLYDWSYTDVWKAIHDNNWSYNKIYDLQYRYGVSHHNMRVSNIHHETAVHALFYLQEAEPETYQKLVKRVHGIDMAGKMGESDFFMPKKLPFMFQSWGEYRDYLLENLITDDGTRANFKKVFVKQEEIYLKEVGDSLFKTHISSILSNDVELTKTENFGYSPKAMLVRRKNKAAKLLAETENLQNQI